MNTKPHTFKRDEALLSYQLSIGGRPAIRLPCHMVTPATATAIACLTEAANLDAKALQTVAAYTDRLDVMVDAYHLAPIWRRVWWAITNNLPYQPVKEAQ